MKKLLFTLLAVFTTTLMGNAQKYNAYYKELLSATPEQRECIVKAYQFGSKHDLGETLAIITWKESSMGKHTVNKNDGKYGSYSPFQILVDSSKARHGIKGHKQIKQLAYRLNNDFDFAANEAVSELKAWKQYWSSKNGDGISTYRKMLASYNAGYKGYYSSRGKAYADDLALRIKVIRAYIAANSVHFVPDVYIAQKETQKKMLNMLQAQGYPVSTVSVVAKTNVVTKYGGLKNYLLAQKDYPTNKLNAKGIKTNDKNTNIMVAML